MTNNNKVVEQEDIEIPEDEADIEEETVEEDERDLKIKELEDKNKKLYARVKRGETKEQKKETTVTPDDSLSQKDLLAVVRADVDDKDLDEVVKFAKGTGMSVAEALQDNTMKAILKTNSEERATALATDAGKSSGGSNSKSIEALNDKVQKGEMPESDKDLERVLDSRYTT